jgi:hypothetical protein
MILDWTALGNTFARIMSAAAHGHGTEVYGT